MNSHARTADLSQLRHGLRTPLNHVIGYAEMLLEDAGAGCEAVETSALLGKILSDAQSVCDLLQSNAAHGEANAEAEITALRNSMTGPVQRIHESLAKLLGLNNADVSRIRYAVSTLMTFIESGELPGTVAPDPLSLASGVAPRIAPGHGLILVVDDDEANRDVLQRHLERQGYEVDQASSGPEALARLASRPFEALLLDLVMPGMNGLQVLDTLKRQTHVPDLPVLVISASDDLSVVAESIQKGAADYLLKPFDPVLLHARLSATLERKRLRDQERLKTAELEQVTAALERSNEDLRRFAYAASHDLQAPVRTIITYLQLFSRRVGPRLSEEESEMIEFAEGAAGRMNALIRDLLLYSHASTDECKLEPVDCQSLLSDLADDLHSLIKETGASVTWQQTMPCVVADLTGMRRVFQNLISNAIKYRGSDAPEVRIAAAQQGDLWRFSVRDNGQGIPAKYRKQIFEMFQRLHGDETPGSGIGLAICQRIVEGFGGTIWVEPAPGGGSVFNFTVPIRKLPPDHQKGTPRHPGE